MAFVLVLLLAFAVYGAVEYAVHRRNLGSIPVRVQVNGTRGKSSVTRLIAAGLRAGGMRVAAKVTGTSPRFITGDSEEKPVRRLGKPNIAEEMRIVRLAREFDAQALVIECMALLPYYQWVENRMLIRPTHGVVTNVRSDHLDVMGPTVADVGRALATTLSADWPFTAERGPELATLRRGVRPDRVLTVADSATVTADDMAGFGYIEHRENVALALAVCVSLGVCRGDALAGMYRATPDPGVMRLYNIADGGKRMAAVNTMAANDPDSIAMLWGMTRDRKSERIVVVNCRRDRTGRSKQLAALTATWDAGWFVATGGLTRVYLAEARRHGIPGDRLLDLGEDIDPAEVYRRVLGLIVSDALVFFTGNTVGYGEDLIRYFALHGASA